MAIRKTIVSGGNARQVLHAPFTANVPVTAMVEHVFKDGILATDILEMSILPAWCRLLSATLIGVGLDATTVQVGLMTGEVFSDDADRILDASIFDPVGTGTQQEATLTKLLPIIGAGAPRSIGVQFGADVTADIAKRLILRTTYAAT